MALTASNATAPADRAWSLGPVRVQLMNFSVVSGDTSGTITADGLNLVLYAQIHGVAQTAAPTFAGNVVTLAFADPAATRFGQALIIGV